MSTLNVNRINDASGGVLAPISSVMRNRLINGSMTVSQRNGTSSVTPDNSYTLDRWAIFNSASSKLTVQQNAGSVTPPAGFSNYLGVTSTSAYSITTSDYFFLQQVIEGFNSSDLAFGTANAKTVTLSFWVRSSLTGTFGGCLQNSAQNRSYPFSYTITAANTWEQKSITVAGDTTGTWLGATNGVGLRVILGLGVGSTWTATAGVWAVGGSSAIWSPTGATSVVGTNGATFYITGVQLEVGTQATSFEYRQYGTELALCQRYFEKSYDIEAAVGTNVDATGVGVLVASGSTNQGGNLQIFIPFKITKRTAPTMTGFTAAGTSGQWTYATSATNGTNGGANFGATGQHGTRFFISTGQNWSSSNASGCWTASAEL